MKPRNIEPQPQNELFKVRLTDLLDMSHPLCRLSSLIDWQQLDAEIAPNFSDQGAPALPTRLVAGLIYLQYAEKLSDEAVVKKLKSHLGRVYRDLLRKLPEQIELTDQQQAIHHAARLLKQTRNSKNKLYSLHAPEVDCISKGKSHKRYEFGVKASIATTLKECFVVGARSFSGNPYDGHTLSSQLEQVSILADQEPEEAYVDRGYKGHQHEGKTKVYIAGQKRGMIARQKTRMNRRNSVEPVIGHLKSDGKLGRCYLKGELGDAMNVILCGAGHNIRKLLRWLCFALIKWTKNVTKAPFCLKKVAFIPKWALDRKWLAENLSVIERNTLHAAG